MKKLLRAACLSSAFVLAFVATASADGNCQIQCANGTFWSGTTSTYFACCEHFGTLCGYDGEATWDDGSGWPLYCPSISIS